MLEMLEQLMRTPNVFASLHLAKSRKQRGWTGCAFGSVDAALLYMIKHESLKRTKMGSLCRFHTFHYSYSEVKKKKIGIRIRT